MNTLKFKAIVRNFEPRLVDEVLDACNEDDIDDISPAKHLRFIRLLIDAMIDSEQPKKAESKPAMPKAAGKTAYSNSVSMESPIRLIEQRLQEQTAKLNSLKSDANGHLRNLLDNAREQTATLDEIFVTERQIEKLYGDNPNVERCSSLNESSNVERCSSLNESSNVGYFQ